LLQVYRSFYALIVKIGDIFVFSLMKKQILSELTEKS